VFPSVVAPRWVLADLFDQVSYPDNAYVGVAGVLAFKTAMQIVITARRLPAFTGVSDRTRNDQHLGPL
jgi:hypothetical protein